MKAPQCVPQVVLRLLPAPLQSTGKMLTDCCKTKTRHAQLLYVSELQCTGFQEHGR